MNIIYGRFLRVSFPQTLKSLSYTLLLYPLDNIQRFSQVLFLPPLTPEPQPPLRLLPLRLGYDPTPFPISIRIHPNCDQC